MVGKNKAFVFLSLWLLGFVSECLGRQTWEAWGRALWAMRWWWGVFLTVWHWDSPFPCMSLSFHIYKVH